MRTALTILTLSLTLSLSAPTFAQSSSDIETLSKKEQAARKKAEALESERVQVRKDVEALKKVLAKAAQQTRNIETDLTTLEQDTRTLSNRAESLTNQIDQDRTKYAELLAALQRLEATPPPTLALTPRDAKRAANAGQLMATLSGQLKQRAETLSLNLKALEVTQSQLVLKKSNLAKTQAKLKSEIQNVNRGLQNKSNLESKLAADKQVAAAEAERLAAESKTLLELIAKLETEAAKIIPRTKPGRKSSPKVVLPKGTKRFAEAKGNLLRPISGRIIKKYGRGEKGLTFVGRASAKVLAPYAGRVEFSGPFKNYENVVILNVGDGFFVLLTGLDELHIDAGDNVRRGEPVGALPGRSNSELYIELRRNGSPVDPSPWSRLVKFVLPALGSVAAIALFAYSTTHQSAVAVERPAYDETFEQLELFADVLARVRSQYVVEVDDSALIEDAMNGMLQSLDPHSSYINPESFRDLRQNNKGEYGGLGMEVTMEDGFVKVIAPIDDTPAKRAGVKAGDFITEIEGKSLLGATLTEAVDQMRGKPGESINITIVREGEDPIYLDIEREVIKRQTVKFELKDGMGYARISQFNEKAADGLRGAVSDLQVENGGRLPGMILDLRGNPGGLLIQSVEVSSVFLDGGEVVSTRGRRADDVNVYNAEKGQMAKNVPLIVLVDGASASASEIVAGALQDKGRALIVGMTTFGKGSVQDVIPLRGGRDGALKITTQRYYTPNGRSIQASGIVPDIVISAVPDDGEDRTRFSEASLPNAIENENEDADSESSEEVEAEIKIDYPPEGFEVSDDYQLQKAIEILKSGDYAQKLAEAQG